MYKNTWNSKLFDCCEKKNISLLYLIPGLQPCISGCLTYQIFSKVQTGRVTPCDGCIRVIFCQIVSATHRTVLRDYYQIRGDPCEDLCTHLFCHCCAIVQEYRQVFSNESETRVQPMNSTTIYTHQVQEHNAPPQPQPQQQQIQQQQSNAAGSLSNYKRPGFGTQNGESKMPNFTFTNEMIEAKPDKVTQTNVQNINQTNTEIIGQQSINTGTIINNANTNINQGAQPQMQPIQMMQQPQQGMGGMGGMQGMGGMGGMQGMGGMGGMQGMGGMGGMQGMGGMGGMQGMGGMGGMQGMGGMGGMGGMQGMGGMGGIGGVNINNNTSNVTSVIGSQNINTGMQISNNSTMIQQAC